MSEVLALGETDSFQQYLQDIRQYDLLSPQQELQLATACAAGDQAAIRQMVNANLRLVVKIARKYEGLGVPLLDLIQEGSVGLIYAAKGFDYTLGNRFSTYATRWIRGEIVDYLQRNKTLIRLPDEIAQQEYKLQKEKQKLTSLLQREPTAEELAEQCNMTPEKVTDLLNLSQICSLDATVGQEEDSLHSLLEDPQAIQPEREAVRRELNKILEAMLSELTDRQQQVLRLRFGMGAEGWLTQAEVARRLDISPQRARELEQAALEKLRKRNEKWGLEEFLR